MNLVGARGAPREVPTQKHRGIGTYSLLIPSALLPAHSSREYSSPAPQTSSSLTEQELPHPRGDPWAPQECKSGHIWNAPHSPGGACSVSPCTNPDTAAPRAGISACTPAFRGFLELLGVPRAGTGAGSRGVQPEMELRSHTWSAVSGGPGETWGWGSVWRTPQSSQNTLKLD